VSSDRLAARLRATFVAELREQVQAMNADLLALEASPGARDRLHALFRIAHTLKGASRAASVPLVERVCHALETLLAEARDGKAPLRAPDFGVLFQAADALADAAERLGSGRDLADSPMAAVLAALQGGGGADAAPPAAQGSGYLPIPAPLTPVPADGQIRVPAAKLDALLAAGADLLVAGGRPALRAAELEALHEDAAGCVRRWKKERRRLLVALERAGNGAAEPSLLALDDALRRLAREADRLATAARADARTLARSVDDVLDHARRMRMRPFAEACEALPRASRDLASAAGKEVDLRVVGGEVEADRVVLDGLRDALLQLVRNAVDHGIEAPTARAHAGKPQKGTVQVEAELKGERLRVKVEDDGAGLDLAGIRTTLQRKGSAAPQDDRELVQAFLEARLSTLTEATTVSGRGVGLDVVQTALQRLAGHMDVAWEDGHGTTFTLDVPLTLASTHALMVSVASQLVAIPLAYVERIRRVTPGDLRSAEGRAVLSSEDGPIPVVSLARLLQPLAERPHGGEAVELVVLRTGPRRLAVVVDALLDTRELAVRPVRAGDARLPALRGAALLDSGRIALVVDPPALVAAGLRADVGAGVTIAEAPPDAPPRRRILVVDDSITTRTLERSILEAAGYEVLTAVDGDDGWRVLQEQGCDLVVADVEMPRMDGFALCEAIRGSRRHTALPVVLVTALESPEHRARGLEAGADAYVGKSSFDQQHLLETIRQLLE